MANFLKKMFDFNIDEKQEEKLEVKEKKATKVDTISTEKVKKASVINFEDKKINSKKEKYSQKKLLKKIKNRFKH